jgi:hypothetical protein
MNVQPASVLLRFTGAADCDPRIDPWFDARPPALMTLAYPWFERLRRCGPDVRELFHDGCPVVCVDDAPFGNVNVFSAHVNVGFFHGAQLPDPAGLLRGSGRHMRHAKLMPGAPVDAPALAALIESAYRDIQARLRADAAARPAG